MWVRSVYGMVDWVRNLRAAKEAILTRGRRSETMNVTELAQKEAALVLREDIQGGNPLLASMGSQQTLPWRNLSVLCSLIRSFCLKANRE